MTPRLDIVVVNWNSGPYLRDCLRAVAAAPRTRFDLGAVAVVDNASEDGSIDALSELGLPLEVVRNGINRGFAVACNQGARIGDGELILFLNPDTRVLPETLDLTVAFMSDPANDRIGVCGGQMLNEEGEPDSSYSRFPTLGMYVAMMTGLSALLPRRFPRQRVSPGEHRGSGPVDQVIGAYFMIRRPLFAALGGFDERFFMYMEDVDLAYRAARAGRPSYFLSNARVHHVGRVSSDRIRARRLFYMLRSRAAFAHKHWPAWQASLLAALQLVVELPVRVVAAIVQGRWSEAGEISAAGRLYYRHLVGRRHRRPGPPQLATAETTRHTSNSAGSARARGDRAAPDPRASERAGP